MKRILFVVIPEKGHINPYIGVAQKLQNDGHDVAFYSAHDVSAQLQAAGLNNFLGEFTEGPPPDRNRGAYFADKVNDQEWLRGWIKELLVDNTPDQVENLKSIVDTFQPDLIVTDPMVYQSCIVAEQTNIKWVAISNSLNPVLNGDIESELLETVRMLDSPRRELFGKYGLEVKCRGCDMISPHLTIAFTTEAFTGYSVPGVEMVGPSIPANSRGDESAFDWSQLRTDVPLIYMSLGSQIYHQPTMFKTVFDAVREKPVQLIATVNELKNDEELGDVPDNVLLAYYTPQLQLLPKVDVMITHGGANSVMEAIYYDTPLLISPICNDQFHQAYFIKKQGVGIELNLQSAAPDSCWKALNELLTSSAIRENMQKVSVSYQMDGAGRAGELIENLL